MRKVTSIYFVLLTCASSGVQAQEEFGRFGENPQGEFILADPRPLFKLTRDFVFSDENNVPWVVPKDEAVDGASIPQPGWSFIGGPFEGSYLYASIIHDYFTCTETKDFVETQDVFWRGLRAAGVSAPKAWYMWAAVRFLGHPRWEIREPQQVSVPCRSASPAVAVFDQMDDRGQKTALAKLMAIQKTLDTSNGTVLDVVGAEVIPTNTPEANRHIDRLAEIAASGFSRDLDYMGTLTSPSELEIVNPQLVAPWAQGDLPALDAYMKANNVGAEYAILAQPKFDITQIDAVLNRLETINVQEIYKLQER